MIYKTFQKVSNVCQLLDKSKYPATRTVNGVTWTNNKDGTITANGTATQDTLFHIFTAPYTKNHIILLMGCPSGGSSKTYCINTSYGNDYGNGIIKKNDRDITIGSIYIRIYANITVSNLVFKPQLFDLTEMYGAGNEPTTVEQFRQDFPEEMYDYKPYCFVKSYKTLLKVSNVCQLLDKSKYPATKTVNGVTFTNNGDGTITVNGTAEEEIYYNIQNIGINRLKFSINIHLNSNHIREIRNNILFEYVGYDKSNGQVFFHIQKGGVCENIVAKPQIFDLTEMYGAGNEPTTVEQFRADFPNELYDYKPYSIIPSYKKSLVCKTKNLFDVSKLYAYTPETLPAGNAGVYNGNIIARANTHSAACASGKMLKELCPDLVAGERYTLSFKSNSKYDAQSIYLIGAGKSLINNNSSVVTEEMLNSTVVFYANYPQLTVATINNFQLELGNTATDYVPYGHL